MWLVKISDVQGETRAKSHEACVSASEAKLVVAVGDAAATANGPRLSAQRGRDGELETLSRRGMNELDRAGAAAEDVAAQLEQLQRQFLGDVGAVPDHGFDVPDLFGPPQGTPKPGDANADSGGDLLDQLLSDAPGGHSIDGVDGSSTDPFSPFEQEAAAAAEQFEQGLRDELGKHGMPTGLAGAFGMGGTDQSAAEQSVLDQWTQRTHGDVNVPAGKPNPMDFGNGADFRNSFLANEDPNAADHGAGNGAGNGEGGAGAVKTPTGVGEAVSTAINAVGAAASTAVGAVAGFFAGVAGTVLTSNGDSQTKGDEVIGLGVFGKWARHEEPSMGSIKDPRQGGGTTERPADIDGGHAGEVSADVLNRLRAKQEGLIHRTEEGSFDNEAAAAKVAQAAAIGIMSVINIGPDDTGQPQGGGDDGDIELPDSGVADPPEPEAPEGMNPQTPGVHPGLIGPNVPGGERGGHGGGLTM